MALREALPAWAKASAPAGTAVAAEGSRLSGADRGGRGEFCGLAVFTGDFLAECVAAGFDGAVLAVEFFGAAELADLDLSAFDLSVAFLPGDFLSAGFAACVLAGTFFWAGSAKAGATIKVPSISTAARRAK